jgi:carboxyl-terminal processing protease
MESTEYSNLKTEIEALKKDVSHNQQEDLKSYQEEIRNVLAERIVSRYYLTKGEIANAISHDPDVKEAIRVLNNKEQYQELLSAK